MTPTVDTRVDTHAPASTHSRDTAERRQDARPPVSTRNVSAAWRPRRRNVSGMVYLLHFNQPFGHARHYTGWTQDVPSRLAAHTAARGAHLVNLVQRAGIGFTVASVEPGTRARERQLKKQGGASRRCRICRALRRAKGGEPTTTPPVLTRS